MKKQLLFIAALLSVGGGLMAQSIPDGGFETWTTTSWQDPQYYNTSNDQGVPQGASANVTQTTGYAGKYGVMMQTVASGGGSQAGYIINGNANGNGFTGGIAYAQKPTGIRFYYKYTPVNKDTAGVLVIFKKSGTPIDSFLITVTAAQANYTLHSYYPSKGLPLAPDTIILGAVSSFSALKNGGGSIGSTFVLDSVTFTGVTSQPADMNGSFENWTKDSILIPNGWYINYPGVTFSTTAYAGKHSLQLETVNYQGGVQVSQASTGYYANCNTNCHQMGGFAFTNQVDTLGFWYQYLPKPNDTADIFLNFIKNGNTINGAGAYVLAQPSWTFGYIPFNVGQVPDTVVVSIVSSNHNNLTSNAQYSPYVGSILRIDNMAFYSQPLAVVTLNVTKGSISVYPNPANTKVSVNLAGVSGSLQKLAVYDMSGRMLYSKDYPGVVKNTIEIIDISSYSSGVYLIEATTNNGVVTQKVSKE
jgi:hypothetical protein